MVGSASGIRRRYQELSPVLDERGRRRFAATEARAYGYGRVSVVSRITGMACSTIARGVEEIIAEKKPVETGWIRGKPLRSLKTMVQLIAATTTSTGLTVRAELDENKYPQGMKISDAKMAAIKLVRHAFHGDWNYTISPQ
jgi:hypothetical protein